MSNGETTALKKNGHILKEILCDEPAITGPPDAQPQCRNDAATNNAPYPCTIITSKLALQSQHRNVSPAHAQKLAHPGGASQHSTSAPSPAETALPPAHTPFRLRPLSTVMSPRWFTDLTALHPHVSTAYACGTNRKAAWSGTSLLNGVRLVRSALAAVHPVSLAA